MNRSRHLLRASLLVIAVFGLNKLTGFVKLILLTRFFGTSPSADAFAAANQLPELLQAMLVGGALSAALIPVYSAYLTSGRRRETRWLSNSVTTLVVLVLGSLSAIVAWLAPWIVSSLLAPEFNPEMQMLTASLMRIVLFAFAILGVASVQSSLLNAHQHFLAPALGTVAIDAGQILGIYFLAPHIGVRGAAWGSVIGAIAYALVQIPALVHFRIGYWPQIVWRLAGLHEVARLMWPRIVTLGAVQAVDLVLIRLASGLPAGSISAYFYALLVVVLMPRSLFGAAISIVVFPTMSEEYNAGNLGGLKQTLGQALRATWLLSIPAVAGLVALGPPAIAFLFERGSFDARASAMVYGVVVVLAARLVAETTQEMLSLSFYARHNTRVPMWASLGWMVLNVVLSVAWVGPMGLRGLALASTVSTIVLAVALYILSRGALGALDEARLVATLARIALASLGMILAVRGVALLGLPTLAYLVVAGGLGAVVYFILYYLLGGREMVAAWRALRSSSDD